MVLATISAYIFQKKINLGFYVFTGKLMPSVISFSSFFSTSPFAKIDLT